VHSGHGERLPERVGRDRLAVAGESEAGLRAVGVDHLAGYHLEVALLLRVPTADITAIKPDHDGTGRLHRYRPLRRFGCVRLHDVLADPQRPVPHRARVLRSGDRQQLGQQGCDLAEQRQGRIPGRHIRQFRVHSRRVEVQDSKALRPT